MENTTELAFIPAPGVGHLAPMVELAKALTIRDRRISITLFIMNLSFHSKVNSYTLSLLSNQPLPRVRFVHLSLDEVTSDNLRSKPQDQVMAELVNIHKPRVKELLSDSTRPVAAFVVDFFCLPFADVAKEFGAPAYVFFTCSAGTLNILFHLQSLHDDENCDITEFKDSDAELRVPGFVNSVPAKVLPSMVFEKNSDGSLHNLELPRELRKFKGILVNTFAELEPCEIGSLSSDVKIPPVYAVGPVLNLNPETGDNVDAHVSILTWLDNQPVASVVFLCFGSLGSFKSEQVIEIARALEQSGHRFLWSLRKPPPKGKMEIPTEYEDFVDILPEGFLDRTKEVGKVIGWAPQTAVLSHPSVGGFVSHCGWNSTLESLWCRVPIATWPLYAEQQLNAFKMITELGLAVEIKMDYTFDSPVILTEEEIKIAINQLMECNECVEIRKKLKAMGEKCRNTIVEDGSSYMAMGLFINDVLNNSS